MPEIEGCTGNSSCNSGSDLHMLRPNKQEWVA